MKNKGLIAAVIVIFGFLLAAFGYQMGAKQTGESAEQPTDQTAKKEHKTVVFCNLSVMKRSTKSLEASKKG